MVRQNQIFGVVGGYKFVVIIFFNLHYFVVITDLWLYIFVVMFCGCMYILVVIYTLYIVFCVSWEINEY